MIQLYFLSILCNGFCGYILLNDSDGGSDNIKISFNNPVFHLVLGILCIVTGFLKLLSPSIGGIPILGDLIPSAAGVFGGFLLIFGIYRKDKMTDLVPEGSLDIFARSLMQYRKTIGLGMIAVTIIHFLFPQALFL